MNHGFRRIVSTTVAISIALGSMLVCAPATALTPQGHCKPAPAMEGDCPHCAHRAAIDCCATSVPQPASAPADTQGQGSRLVPMQAVGDTPAAVVSDAARVPCAARALRLAPSHGYRSTDLPTLNAVFLI